MKSIRFLCSFGSKARSWSISQPPQGGSKCSALVSHWQKNLQVRCDEKNCSSMFFMFFFQTWAPFACLNPGSPKTIKSQWSFCDPSSKSTWFLYVNTVLFHRKLRAPSTCLSFDFKHLHRSGDEIAFGAAISACAEGGESLRQKPEVFQMHASSSLGFLAHEQ